MPHRAPAGTGKQLACTEDSVLLPVLSTFIRGLAKLKAPCHKHKRLSLLLLNRYGPPRLKKKKRKKKKEEEEELGHRREAFEPYSPQRGLWKEIGWRRDYSRVYSPCSEVDGPWLGACGHALPSWQV